MQETLAHDWRRRMAGRSFLVAMLLAIPVLMALAIGFSGGVGGLSFGIGSLASGPENSSVTTGTPANGPAGLGALGPVPAAAAGGGGVATGGGIGGTPTVTGPGAPPTITPIPPGGGGPAPGGTRQVGPTATGGGTGGGGSTSPLPGPSAVPDPGQAATDPVGTADEVVGTAQDTVNGLINPHR